MHVWGDAGTEHDTNPAYDNVDGIAFDFLPFRSGYYDENAVWIEQDGVTYYQVENGSGNSYPTYPKTWDLSWNNQGLTQPTAQPKSEYPGAKPNPGSFTEGGANTNRLIANPDATDHFSVWGAFFGELGFQVANTAADEVPYLGEGKAIAEITTGLDARGDEIGIGGRVGAGIGLIPGGAIARKAAEGLAAIAKGGLKLARHTLDLTAGYFRRADDVADAVTDTAKHFPGTVVTRVVNISERNLQKGFTKHGADFGLTGKWNPQRAAEFSEAINKHVNATGTSAIVGSYRGQAGFTHYLDPITRLNVVVDSNGNYVTGFRLGENQLSDLLSNGHLW